MDPPFNEDYKALLAQQSGSAGDTSVEECELPVADLGRLKEGATAAEECKKEIVRASEEWGFFQVVNHGISMRLLGEMRLKQMELFKEPFERKKQADKFMDLPAGSYRWGSPTATSLRQLSWNEAFQLSLSDILRPTGRRSDHLNLRSTMEQFAGEVSSLAQKLAEILAENLGSSSKFFRENCVPSTCHLRMNRYPPCPLDLTQIFGLMPHTDSYFLTILHQDDQVGGLQILKDGRWTAVKPNPDALITNIGDFFQAWSNNVYKSVQHRVVANSKVERYSVAYFFSTSNETVIKSECKAEAAVYRRFSVREFMKQVEEDIKNHGYKIGLSRFVL